MEISSSPSAPCTTNARFTPNSPRARAINSVKFASNTPTTCAEAPAGFVSGPSKLNTVRMRSSRRADMACRVAACTAGAKRNPIPTSSMACATRSGGRSMRTPKCSSTSAEPQRELMDRLPCLATCTPAPAITNAATVETLKVPEPSPPVPQVSTRASIATGGASAKIGVAWRRIAVAKPTNSSTVSPFMRNAVSNAGDLRVGGAPGEDFLHSRFRFDAGEVFLGNDFFQRFVNHIFAAQVFAMDEC